MEVIHTILVIYLALWWGSIVTLAGTQTMFVLKYNNLVLRGEDVTLTCYFPFNMWSSNCRWYFTRNEAVERQLNGTRYTWLCSPNSRDPNYVPIQLSFKNVTFADTGKYTCETTASRVQYRGELLLNVHAKPEITVPNTNLKAAFGTSVTLECVVNPNGDTSISIGWQNMLSTQWNNVTNSNKYYWTTQIPSLVISEVSSTDSGFYRCVASNPLVTVTGSQIYLTVQYFPLVTVQQTQFFIASGEDVVLNCVVNGRGVPIINIKWYRQYQASLSPLPNNTKYGWRQQGSDVSIKISKVIETDAGIYVCEGTTEVGSSKGKDIELRVGYKPTVRVNEYNYSIGIGDNLTLHCSIDGHGSAVKGVEWLKQENSQYGYIQSSTRAFWEISNPSLKIINVRLYDTGKYKCRGVTELGMTDSQHISVQVFYKPTVTVNKHNYNIGMGDNITLHCSVDGHDSTVKMVEWFKQENSQYRNLQPSTRVFWDISIPSLKIINVSLDDAGKYKCKGTTEFGMTESQQISVQVLYKPTITVNKHNYNIGMGDNITLHCSIDGHDSTVKKVEWFKQENSQYRNLQPSTRVFWDISFPSLKIINVSLDDAGNYTCKGMTEFGTIESQQISVHVFYLPVINPPDKEDLTGSSLGKYVVPGVSVVACVALIALIVVVILIRRKRLKERTDKPNSGIRSTNGQQQPSLSENICSGNDHAKFYVNLSEDMTYAQVIRKSNKNIDGNKSSGDTKISQSNTHIDGSNYTRETDTSQVYMNINNTYAAVQHRSSTSHSNSNIHEETESENTQVKRNEQLNYAELEFGSNAQGENSSLVIRGSPSNTTYTDVVVFTR